VNVQPWLVQLSLWQCNLTPPWVESVPTSHVTRQLETPCRLVSRPRRKPRPAPSCNQLIAHFGGFFHAWPACTYDHDDDDYDG
jgi:hypothetical protein